MNNGQIPLDTFPHNLPIDGEVANLLRTCWQQVVVMEFGKRHDTTGTTDFCPRQPVTDLLFMLWTCYREVANLLRTCYGETGVMDFGLNTDEKTVGWDSEATLSCSNNCL